MDIKGIEIAFEKWETSIPELDMLQTKEHKGVKGTRKLAFTAGAEYGYKQALEKIHFMIDEPKNYPNRNAKTDLDILTKWVDTELEEE